MSAEPISQEMTKPAAGIPRYSVAELVSGLQLAVAANSSMGARGAQGISADGGLATYLEPADEGGRNNRLAQLAGALIARDLKTTDVIALVELWNRTNPAPLDEAELCSTVESIARTHERNRSVAANDWSLDEATPLFSLESARVDRFLTNDPLPRQWLLRDTLPLGKVGAIIAPGGTGKSQFVLQLAVAVATGTRFAEAWDVGERGGVLVLAAEDDDEELHRRFRNIADRALGTCTELHKRLRENLYIKSMVSENNLMTVTDGRNREVVRTPYAEQLAMVTSEIPNLRLIVVDPASRFRGGDENSAEDSTRFVEALEYLSKATGATILIVHHATKGSSNASEQTQNASRGSSAFTDGVRFQLNLAPVPTKDVPRLFGEHPATGRFLTAKVTKNNYAPPQDEVYLMRSDGGYLIKAATQSRIISAEDLDARILALVDSEAKEGRQHTASKFETDLGGEAGPLRAGKVAVRKALKRLLEQGRLAKKGGGKVLTIVRDASQNR
ncbi:MAG: AAA family ATPase [Pseudomonadota bacterium]